MDEDTQRPEPDTGPDAPKRRRLRSVLVVVVLAAVASAVMWGRSYARRDSLAWESDRPQARRVSCRLYSSRGRILFLSYSRPTDPGAAGARQPFSFQTGDRAATEALSDEVHTHARQAGLGEPNILGLGYSQHVGSMASGTHVWTAAVLPWWFLGVIAGAIAYGWTAPRRRKQRRRWGRFKRW